MRWLSASALLLVGCVSYVPTSHRLEIDKLEEQYAGKLTDGSTSGTAAADGRLLDEVGEWALYRLTAADGSHSYEKIELVANDGCGIWVTSEILGADEKYKQYLCLKTSSSHESSDRVDRVLGQVEGGTPIPQGYWSAAGKKKEIGSITDRLFIPALAIVGDAPDGAHYELVDRGRSEHPQSEIDSLADRLMHATYDHGPLIAGRFSFSATGGAGVSTAHAHAGTRKVGGVGADIYLRVASTLELIESLRVDEESYDLDGDSKTRRRSLLALGVRWSPNIDDYSSWRARGFYVRSAIGEVSLLDRGDSKNSDDGIGIETALGWRRFSRHAESALGYEVAHSMSVFPDAGVQHVLMLRLSIEVAVPSRW